VTPENNNNENEYLELARDVDATPEEGAELRAPATPKNEYTELAEEAIPSLKTSLQRSRLASGDVNPDKAARAQRLARDMRLPISLIENNLEEVEAEYAKKRLDVDVIAKDSPALGGWLSNPENLGIAKDDLEVLQRIESGVKAITPAPVKTPRQKLDELEAAAPDVFGQRQATAAKTALEAGWNDLNESAYYVFGAYGFMTVEEMAEATAEYNKRAAAARGKLPPSMAEFRAMTEKETGEISAGAQKVIGAGKSMGLDSPTNLAMFLASRGRVGAREVTLQALKDFASGSIETIGEALDILFKTFGQRPKETMLFVTENLPQSAPAIGLGAVGSASPIPFAGPAGAFMGGAFVEIGASIREQLSKRGVDVTNPEAIAAAYKDPKFVSEVRAAAERRGITVAAVDALFQAFGGKNLAGAKTLRQKVVGGAKDVGKESVGEVSGEFAGQVAEHKGDLTKTDPGAAFLEGIASLGQSGAQTVISATSQRKNYPPDPVDGTKAFAEDVKKAFEAAQNAAQLNNVAEAVRESKVAGPRELPEKVAELIDIAGGDGKKIYFQSDDWDAYWTSKGASPAKAAEQIMGDAKSYHDAKSSGGLLEMSLGAYVTQVANTEHWDALLQSAKTDPDGPTLAQAKEVLTSLPATMNELAQEAVAQDQPEQLDVVETLAFDDVLKPGDTVTLKTDTGAAQTTHSGTIESFTPGKAHKLPDITIDGKVAHEGRTIVRDGSVTIRTASGALQTMRTDSIVEMSRKKVPAPDPVKLKREKLETDLKQVGGLSSRQVRRYGELFEAEERVFQDINKGAIEDVPLRVEAAGETTAEAATETQIFEQARLVKGTNVVDASEAFQKRRASTSALAAFTGGERRSLTLDELRAIRDEVRAISEANELADPDRDGDVLDNNLARLDELQAAVRESMEIRKKRLGDTFEQSALPVPAGQQLPATTPQQSPLGFYSQVEAEVSKMDFKSMPAKDLAARIKNIQGIKAEELEWMGLQEWLKVREAESANGPITNYRIEGFEPDTVGATSVFHTREQAERMLRQTEGANPPPQYKIVEVVDKNDGKVTKEEVLAFIRSNGVKVEQVVLSSDFKGDDPTAGIADLDWSEPEHIGNFYENDTSDEWDYYRNDYLKNNDEFEKEWREEHADEFDSEAMLEKALSKAMDEEASRLLEAAMEDPDHHAAKFSVRESTTGWDLVGSNEYGWYSSELGETLEVGLEEAKVQLALKMLESGEIEGERSALIQEKDIKWTRPQGETPGYDTLKRKAKALFRKNKKKYVELSKSPEHRYYWEDEETDEAKEKAILDNALNLARSDVEESYVDLSNKRNKITVGIYHPVQEGQLKGNNVKGWEFHYSTGDDRGTVHVEKLQAKDLEQAKAEAIAHLKEAGIIGKPPEKAEQGESDVNTPTGKSRFGSYKVEGGENYREILLRLPGVSPEFDEGHFSQSNVLAHVRITDRTDAEGRKVLFVEELQSDWHQKGRERGYKDESTARNQEELIEAREAAKNALAKADNLGFDHSSQALAAIIESEDFAQRWDLSGVPDLEAILRRYREAALANQAATTAEKDAIPDAPFKNTDAWAALAMKRIIRMAVEQGYDAVAWSPAEVHTERWGTDSISWVKTGPTFGVRSTEVDKGWRYFQSKSEAEDWIGEAVNQYEMKEFPSGWLVGSVEQVGGRAGEVQDIEALARERGKLLEKRGVRVTSKEELRKVIADTLHRERNERSLEALTESVWKQMQEKDSGVKAPRKEGFEFFYDNLLPKKVVPGILKKLDKAAKVEVGTIDPVPYRDANNEKALDGGLKSWEVVLTDELKAKAKQGFTLFQPAKADPFKAVTPEQYVAERKKNKRVDFLSPTPVEGLSQHKLFLTDDGVGYALSPEGDLQGVFNNSGRPGAGVEAVVHAIAQGAKTLDCYAGYLPEYYSNFGFVVTKSEPWNEAFAPNGWNYEEKGRPDVVYMEFPEALSRAPEATRVRHELARRERKHRASGGTDGGSGLAFSGKYGAIDWSVWGGVGQEVSPAAPRGAGVPQGNVDPRGSITFLDDETIIRLSKSKDPSTVVHELAHRWLDRITKLHTTLLAKDPAQLTDKQKSFLERNKTLLEWFGIDSFDKMTREHHEMFARGWEKFVATGKAPSSRLRQAFNDFKLWILSVYKALKNINVELTPEVEAYFQRMVATEEEIAEASGKYPELDAGQLGITGPAGERLEAARAEAREATAAALQERLSQDHARKFETWYQEERAQVRERVAGEISKRPEYRALSELQKKDGIRLNKKAMMEEFQFGSDRLKRLPRPTIYSKEGVHPNLVAETFGFNSGEELLAAIEIAEPMEALIDRVTDAEMKAKHGDLLTDGRLPEAAEKALHNAGRAKVLRMELEWIAENKLPALKGAMKFAARRVPSEKTVREQAARTVGTTKVTDLKPYLFERAERRYAKEAGEALAKGDFEALFEAKRKELLNHELYRAAIEAEERVEKFFAFFRRLRKSDEDIAKTRDMDLVNAARAVLATFGLDTSEKTAAEYLKPIQQYDPDTFETMISLVEAAAAGATSNWKESTFDSFSAMGEAVQALWDLAKSTREIEIDGKKEDLAFAREELEGRLMEVSKPGKRAGYDKAATSWDKAEMSFLGMKASLRRVESWVDAIDDEVPVFRKYLWGPISDAATKFRLAKGPTLEKFLNIIKPIEKTLVQKKIAAPELNYQFSGKAELLGAILHTGNESNFSKLLRGRGWGEVDFEGNLDSSRWKEFIERMYRENVITKEDMDVVQAIWDLFEETKPQAQAVHKQLYGHYFSEITANELVTPFGTYRGGYVPAKADPFLAQDAAIREEKNALEGNNSFSYPSTGRGHTKKRVEAYAAPLVMDLRMIPMALDAHLRFIHLQPAVKAVARIVMHRGFRKSLDAFDPTVGGDMLVPWLQRAASQRVSYPTGTGWGWKGIDGFFKAVRKRTGLQVMAANVVNTAQNVTGFSMANVKVKKRHLRDALWTYIRAPKETAAAIEKKSQFMRTRQATQVYDIQKQIEDIVINPTGAEKVRDWAQKHGYFLQSGLQNIIDTIVWQGAYEQAIEKNPKDEAAAVKEADSAVRLTQGSFNPEDISRVESGGDTLRAFLMFYSYFNMQANLLGSEAAKIQRDLGMKKGTPRALQLYAMGFMVPAMVASLIVAAGSGKIDEDDDDKYMDDLIAMFFDSQFRTATAMVPVIGQVAQYGVNLWNDKQWDDRITVSPALSLMESAGRAPFSGYDAIVKGGSKKRAIKDFLSALGLFTGLPVAPLGKPLGFIADVQEGKAKVKGPVDLARGLVTGKASERKRTR
jgi:DNA-binding protein H-NS